MESNESVLVLTSGIEECFSAIEVREEEEKEQGLSDETRRELEELVYRYSKRCLFSVFNALANITAPFMTRYTGRLKSASE